MTIISTIISRSYTVHATDSLITTIDKDGNNIPKEEQKSKIIKVDAFQGIMSFWGMGWYKYGEREVFMRDWLAERAKIARKFNNPEEFANFVANELTKEFSRFTFANPRSKGLGIHFSAYEKINNQKIPELFLISNWDSDKYNYTFPRWEKTRHTFQYIPSPDPKESIDSPESRLKFNSYLLDGGIAFFNNGDPILFNPIARGVMTAVNQLSLRAKSKGIDNADSLIALAQTPIEAVSKIQTGFCIEGQKIVGGKPHNLSVCQRTNEYHSTSGDEN